jgi:phytoene dehydrogenase-like protein
MRNNAKNSRDLGGVAVIGGGLGGLTAAVYLARAGRSVTIFDTRQRLGGRAVTDERRGFLFNQGPHALYRQGEAEAVLIELGIRPRGGQPDPQSATIVRNDERHLGPSNLVTLLRTSVLTFREKRDIGGLLARVPRLRPAEFAHLTVDEWLDGSLASEGARQLAAALVLPLPALQPG